MHKITEFLFWILRYPVQSIKIYQDRCRIYLDEYPEAGNVESYKKPDIESEKELPLFLEVIRRDTNNDSKQWYDLDECWKELDILFNEHQEKDTYFERRWLRRN